MTERNINQQIRYPDSKEKEGIIKRLGLDGPPSKEDIRGIIEEHWLTPKDRLPEHWLGQYQMSIYLHEESPN